MTWLGGECEQPTVEDDGDYWRDEVDPVGYPTAQLRADAWAARDPEVGESAALEAYREAVHGMTPAERRNFDEGYAEAAADAMERKAGV